MLVRLCRGSCMTCTIHTMRQIPAAVHRPFLLLFSILQAPELVSTLHSRKTSLGHSESVGS